MTMTSSSSLLSSPATAALDMLERQSKLTAATSRGGPSSSLSKLSLNLCDLNFDDDHHDDESFPCPIESFPVIEWDANDDVSESSDDSVKSSDTWNSIFHSTHNDFGSSSSLGKRSRRGSDSSSANRRLVRSKKIKSGLSSLAVASFAARSA